MPHFTAQCGYHAHYATTVHVEAPDLETACVLAVEAANSTELWTTTDHCGDTFVDAIAEGDHAHPWGPGALPVPARFTERGEPPAISITAESAPGAINVVRGPVRITVASAAGSLTTDRPPQSPMGTKPLVIVRLRPEDGRPDITVTGGDVRVRILD